MTEVHPEPRNGAAVFDAPQVEAIRQVAVEEVEWGLNYPISMDGEGLWTTRVYQDEEEARGILSFIHGRMKSHGYEPTGHLVKRRVYKTKWEEVE